jgi:uncharacterized protein YijF (DUF1287 family)
MTGRGVAKKLFVALTLGVVAVAVVGAFVLLRSTRFRTLLWAPIALRDYAPNAAAAPAPDEVDDLDRLAGAAETIARRPTVYDPAYVVIDYPGGDVSPDRGVCTDVVIRAYRTIGVDLQQAVFEDMSADFEAYPDLWGLTKPDPNIDHRRVPNLMTWFQRHGDVLPITANGADYLPGDILTWDLGAGWAHIGVVTAGPVPGSDRHLIAHHIGGPPRVDDVLFEWPIMGHYRYVAPHAP